MSNDEKEFMRPYLTVVASLLLFGMMFLIVVAAVAIAQANGLIAMDLGAENALLDGGTISAELYDYLIKARINGLIEAGSVIAMAFGASAFGIYGLGKVEWDRTAGSKGKWGEAP